MISIIRSTANTLHTYPRYLKHIAAGWIITVTFLTAVNPDAYAQPGSSVDVPVIAGESPDYLVKAVSADDFRERPDSEKLESKPYSESSMGRAKSTGPVYHQPAGALTGKSVFAMAGHGWTYDSEEMYYYTQRGLSHGMVEDMGNADQMHIFAHMLLNSGANVFPLRPVDYQPQERVIDNTMSQVELYGDWRSGTSDRFYGSASDEVPYAVTSASLQETAVARYRPYIPESGYYPVYVWARDGNDRSNQLYRVVYSGGVAEMKVNWRRAGKTWAWLGTYYFDQGTTGYLEVSNKVADPYEAYYGHVVIADAVRFGNGYGDVPRPGGISGYSREDEGDSYWIERALGVNADRRLFDVGRDGSSTVSAPPKAAAYANRENEGSFLDRILISFHSNASSGKARGAVALYNSSALQRPTYQESLAEIIGRELNTQMTKEEPPAAEDWAPRERHTYAGINFGELRRDYLQNEMSATIVETAFHDNPADVSFLLDPIARMQMAQATLRGVLRWYAEVAYPNSAFVLPPARPVAIAATQTEEGKIQIKWKPGNVGEYDGGSAQQVRVYRSTNGFGFDGGIPFDATTESIAVDPATTTGVTFLKVTATNSAGESFPSQVIAVGINKTPAGKSKKATSLLVPVTTVLDRTTNLPYYLGGQPGGPYKESAYTERVRPVYNLLFPSGAAEALALSAASEAFNGADTAALDADLLDLSGYQRLFVAAETQNPATPLLSTDLLSSLRSHINSDGKLYLAGSGVIDNLVNSGGRHRAFVREVAGVTDETTAPVKSELSSLDNRFYSTTASLALAGNSRHFAETAEVTPAVFKSRSGRSIPLLTYAPAGQGAAAILTRPSSSEGEVVVLGFSLSLLKDADARSSLMAAILKQI